MNWFLPLHLSETAIFSIVSARERRSSRWWRMLTLRSHTWGLFMKIQSCGRGCMRVARISHISVCELIEGIPATKCNKQHAYIRATQQQHQQQHTLEAVNSSCCKNNIARLWREATSRKCQCKAWRRPSTRALSESVTLLVLAACPYGCASAESEYERVTSGNACSLVSVFVVAKGAESAWVRLVSTTIQSSQLNMLPRLLALAHWRSLTTGQLQLRVELSKTSALSQSCF